MRTSGFAGAHDSAVGQNKRHDPTSRLIIADCSGRNANVFYELGLAHAHGKQVILITKDQIADTPTDVRHFEFIRYELDAHVAFIERLDNALHQILFELYEPLYQTAMGIFRQFTAETSIALRSASKEKFISLVRYAEQASPLPSKNEESALERVLLPKIVADSADLATMEAIVTWISGRGITRP
jgi:hypothetical protein